VVHRLLRDDRGQDLIEYVLLGSFVAIAALLGVTALGTNINTWYSAVSSWAAKQATKIP
jgi:Flp pilus assembly pilin Flp